jgi:hypothetical protein
MTLLLASVQTMTPVLADIDVRRGANDCPFCGEQGQMEVRDEKFFCFACGAKGFAETTP